MEIVGDNILLEKIYSKEDINEIFSHYDEIFKSDPGFADEVMESEEIVFKRIKGNYANIDDNELKEIIHFGIIVWSHQDVIKFGKLNYCNRCGFCCLETSPILIQTIESQKYLSDSFFKDNIMPNGTDFSFISDSPCKYYDEPNKKCTIYNKRPINCQQYPIGLSAVCVSPNCKNSLEIAIKKIESLIKECEQL